YHLRRKAVPAARYETPLGCAAIARSGRDVSLIAYGASVPAALRVAAELEGEGISLEVVDLRTLAPLDTTTILDSVRRTGRVVIAHEAWTAGGVGAEVAASIAEAGLPLAAPLRRVGARPVPVPSVAELRELALPSRGDLRAAVRAVLRGGL